MSCLIRISTWQVFSAPVKEDKEYLVTLWVPYEQVCRNCNWQYVIYTPSRITRDVRMGEPTETEAVRQLEAAAQRACPPVNGCPRCHDDAHVSKEVREEYRKKTRRQIGIALSLCLVGIVGAGLLYYVQTQQSVEAGVVLSIAKAMGGALPVSVRDIYVAGACLILASVYSAYRILLRRGSIGLWVCAGEGLILENLEQESEHEAICPSCKSAMVPIWDVKL
jgi:Zn finger protein HypA/HybF involved in hydrogenase expression